MERYIVVPLVRNGSAVTIWTIEILIVVSRDFKLPNNELIKTDPLSMVTYLKPYC